MMERTTKKGRRQKFLGVWVEWGLWERLVGRAENREESLSVVVRKILEEWWARDQYPSAIASTQTPGHADDSLDSLDTGITIPPSDQGIEGAVPLPPSEPAWGFDDDGMNWPEQNRKINDLLMRGEGGK